MGVGVSMDKKGGWGCVSRVGLASVAGRYVCVCVCV